MFRSYLPMVLYGMSIALSLFVIAWYFMQGDILLTALIPSLVLLVLAAALQILEGKRLEKQERERDTPQQESKDHEQTI